MEKSQDKYMYKEVTPPPWDKEIPEWLDNVKLMSYIDN